jgi:prepilin-type N-terminal cleavage/methylation domain-containing protein
MNRQRGMTMVELVVAIAVTGIIIAFLGTAIHQIITVSGYGNDRLTAGHELQNAAHWFNSDGQRAKAATGGTGLKLTMTDNSSVTFALVGTELRRTASSYGLEPTIIPTEITPITLREVGAELPRAKTGYTMVLARNIASASFTVDDRLVTMSLTATPPGRYGVSENGTYRVYLRPAEEV